MLNPAGSAGEIDQVGNVPVTVGVCVEDVSKVRDTVEGV
jgi:hypothetical protein